MNAQQLSMRLAAVAAFVPEGAKLADIGSDHAYLPCYLANKGLISSAIAGEVVEGPFLSAKRQVETEGLENIIQVRMGNGLEVISSNEADCITIAGMGGALIAEILEAGKDKIGQVTRLVLQPNVSAISVREWLRDNGWELIKESILEEDGKIYEILVAEKGIPDRPYEKGLGMGLLFGPFLLEQKNDVFIKKWTIEKENWQRIIKQLDQARETEETKRKKEEIFEKIKLAEEVLND